MRRANYLQPTEDADQEALVKYCLLKSIPIVHIPNESKRSASYGAKLKRMGLAPGFPDLFIPKAVNGAHGLFIELKTAKGKTSKEQKDWIMLLRSEGYTAYVCRGFDAAKKAIELYLKGELQQCPNA